MSAARSLPLAFVGLRCSGKTSVGRELARILGREFHDLDDATLALGQREVKVAIASVGELLLQRGEPAFRELESRALRDALARAEPCVLATGGGVVERGENRAALVRGARCVWLRVETGVLQARLRADPALRPGLLGGDPALELAELARRRAPWYAEVAELALDCGEDLPTRLAERIVDGFELG